MWYMILFVLGALVFIIVVWIINLSMRPINNQDGLSRGLDTRSAAKLHRPREPQDTKRELWPWQTDLREKPIAGLGVTHMFNFEFALLAWAALVAIAWLFLAVFVDMDFLRLGTRDPGKTPRDHCIMVQWGYTTQKRLMSAKLWFVFGLYIASFLLAVAYSIYALRKHNRLDAARLSHKDFCAKCIGLPCLSGNYKVLKEKRKSLQHFFDDQADTQTPREQRELFIEDTIRKAVKKATGVKVLGVSVCWDFQDDEDFLQKVINYDYETRIQEDALLETSNISGSAAVDLLERKSIREEYLSEKARSWLTRLFISWEKVLLSPSTQRVIKKSYEAHPSDKSAMARAAVDLMSPREDVAIESDDVRKKRAFSTFSAVSAFSDDEERKQIVCDKLNGLKTTQEAFIIFDTEGARDDAITKAQQLDGISYQYVDDSGETRTAKLQLVEESNEPQAVNWQNFGNKNLWVNMFLGLLCIFCALVIWCCCFYLPYAYSVMRADYAHGTDPNLFARTMFGFVVVAGNAVMYVVCAEVSDRIGFKTRSEREVCYMLLYCFACVFNVLLDLGMSYQMAYKQMVGMGMRTHDGEHLSDVHSFSARFETYAMQKSLGGLLLDYAFPSTFLIPFLIEPFVVIYLPWKVMMLIVRTHPAIIAATAEAYLSSTPMDLSRYADVLLNLMLATLIFFFPGGYVLYIFVGLIVSHLFIYAYDRWRVLRSIPDCDFATFDVEWWAQWLLSIPCGMLLSCAVFKASCKGTETCWNNKTEVVERCWLLFFAHIAVHTLVLLYVVPFLSGRSTAEEVKHGERYEACAKSLPSSFFSANPVHCLRSQYIFEHTPPFRYYIPGKDYMLEENTDIHAYYKAEKPDSENYEEMLRRSELMGAIGGFKDDVRGFLPPSPFNADSKNKKKLLIESA
jgi:hypothetical protein